MDQLIGKLTNLGYEFFAIILPGLIAQLLACLLWAALGPMVPYWTMDAFPECQMHGARGFLASLTYGDAAPALALAYFLGHALHWVSRSKPPAKPVSRTLAALTEKPPAAAEKPNDSNKNLPLSYARARLPGALFARIPKPRSFQPHLTALYKIVEQDFRSKAFARELLWVEFFPLAKSFLAQHLKYSLVSTYQNKYTLHRSISTAAAILFWMCVAAMVWATFAPGPEPYWGRLGLLTLAAFVVLWNFSASYVYNWEMFGNTIVTETFSLLHGPHARRAEKPAGDRLGDERD